MTGIDLEAEKIYGMVVAQVGGPFKCTFTLE
jgi:hypothetical protein